MQATFVTKEEFDEKYENICKGINELKERYYTLDKKIEVIDTKIDAMRVEFDTKTNTIKVELKQDINTLRVEMGALRTEMNERFNSLEKRFMMMWALMIIILLGILGLYLRGMIS